MGGRVEEVRIEGSERIEPETVRSYLTVQPGDQFDADKLDKSLKVLFATGLFADVTMRRDGSALIVKVVENPIINRVAYEGNDRFDDKALNDEVQLKPRTVYTRTRVQADVKRILDLYRRSGRFAVTVEPKIIQLPQNRVDLVFEINEGKLTGINSINFIGNKAFSNDALQHIIQTKESRWYRFLSSDDNYDPDRVTYDRELLRKYYLSGGYADFRVVSAVAELTPARDGFILTFTVDEGERYHFGHIGMNVGLKDLTPADLMPVVLTKDDEWYNADLIEKSIDKLTAAVGDRGYAFIDVRPLITRNKETRTIDLTYDIAEGPAGLCRTYRRQRQRAHARHGHPPRIRAGRGRCLQHVQGQEVRAEPKEPGLLQESRRDQRPGFCAGQDRHHRQCRRAVDRRSDHRYRLLDDGRPVGQLRHP